MKKNIVCALLVSMVVTRLIAITISNESLYDLFGATYYVSKDAQRVSDIREIKAGAKAPFDRPSFKGIPDRMLVFSINKDDLKSTLTSSEYHLLPSTPIAVGNDFFIDLDKGSFKGYNAAEWRVFLPIKKKVGGVVDKLDDLTLGKFRSKNLALQKYPEQNLAAEVRVGRSLPPQEIEFLSHRMPKVHVALEKLLGMKLSAQEVPTITAAGSGGGYRAMLGFLGFLEGAQETGLLDTFSHVSALSGSTWTLGPWISSGWSLDEFQRRLLGKISKDLLAVTPDVSSFTDHLTTRLAFKQPISLVSIYARILGYNLLSDLPGGPFASYVHTQKEKIQDGSYPLPIYTAVATKLPYQWVEFTPYEMGGDYFGGYIPMWSFGAPFLNGKMEYFTPPYTLSFILAICGSAFAARLSQVAQEVTKKIPVKAISEALEAGTEDLGISKFRPSAASVNNWTWGMRALPRSEQRTIKLIDAGIAYNIGLESLYRRDPQFIIVADFSASQKLGSELRKAEEDLRARGFKVPPISYEDIGKKPYSVFKDPKDPKVPVIFYIPQSSNANFPGFDPQTCKENWCSTFNFNYPQENAAKLIELSRQSVKDMAPAFINELKLWVASIRKK